MKHLSALTDLSKLVLNNTQIGDKGLKHLNGLTVLRFLVISNTRVSKDGISRFCNELPECMVMKPDDP